METHRQENTNSIVRLFDRCDKKILSVYCTAGFPAIDSLKSIVEILEDCGVDMIEIGIPFSDPLADGPVIQASNAIAIANGMTVDRLFHQLENITTDVPLVLMGYFNPVLQFGVEEFCRRCNETGIAGVIFPDLPVEIFLREYSTLFHSNHLCNILMITPKSTPERIRFIDQYSTGFIYAVTGSSTTGSVNPTLMTSGYLRQVSEMGLRNPVLTGFNIRDRASYQEATAYTRGGIVGSAFIERLAVSSNLHQDIREFIQNIRSQ